MEKLTIQELAAYLPWEVEMIFEGKGGRRGILQTIGTTQWGDTISIGTGGMWLKSCGFLPILYPLSHLTKPINHKGEEFVPIDYFLGEDVDLILNAVQINDLSYLPYNIIQKLQEWNFDTLGLIDRGLATDKSTL